MGVLKAQFINSLKCVCRSGIDFISNLNPTFAKIKQRLFLVNMLGCEKGS